MVLYRVYVKGHGGEESQKFPPSKDLPIDLITIGEFGCTMSDEVADKYIDRHVDAGAIQRDIEAEMIIYWTYEEREDWYRNKRLRFVRPKLTRTPYVMISQNLALDGDAKIGTCGVAYWDQAKAELIWLIKLRSGQSILLSGILQKLSDMLHPEDTIELYWTACMKADYWQGARKKVSFNPTK